RSCASPPSCAGLSRASTSLQHCNKQAVDGRNKSGHDASRQSGHDASRQSAHEFRARRESLRLAIFLISFERTSFRLFAASEKYFRSSVRVIKFSKQKI